MDFYLNFKLKMSRICIVVQNYYDIDPRVRRTVECLIDSGYSVDVFSLRSEEQSREKYKYNGVNIISISLGKKRASKLRYVLEYIIFFLWAFFRVTHYSLKQKWINNHSNDKFIFMYHGTLTRLYGLDIAIRAFSKVCARSDDVEFWIIGEGPEKDNLKSIIQDQGIISKVKFIGLVPQQEIPSWLRKCDVGVLATRKDMFSDLSFSNKLPEYIITGKPVIISRLKAIRFYFSEQALAYFEPNNVDDLVKVMLDLLENSKRRQNMVKFAQKEYQAINWDVMKHRYLNLIKATEN